MLYRIGKTTIIANKCGYILCVHVLQKSKPTENDGSDSDEQVFRRRNLVSNWSRYDDLPDDDDDELPSHRGEDFNKILAAAGINMSLRQSSR